MAKHKQHHEEEAGEAWLLPYSDLMTLLLALFIALFAISQVDQDKASEVALKFKGYMTEEKKGDKEGTQEHPPEGVGLNPSFYNVISEGGIPILDPDGDTTDWEKIELENLENQLNDYASDTGLEGVISTKIDERGLVISLAENTFFNTGEAEVLDENIEIVIQIGELIKKIDNYIRIEGHTDSRPISNAKYRNNWDLANARATSVLILLNSQAGIDTSKLASVGYADTRPLAEEYNEDGTRNEENMAKNRRVDLVILSSKYNALETQEHLTE